MTIWVVETDLFNTECYMPKATYLEIKKIWGKEAADRQKSEVGLKHMFNISKI